jgi:predicted nuclease of predicted toxin-antitoxin system
VKVLFDHNVPHKLRQWLPAHDVSTADELGWSELENGELLRAAEIAGFAVMVTADKNLSSQQNLRGVELAVVVLSTNNWNVLRHNPRPFVDAEDIAKPGSFHVVTLESPLARHRRQTPKP